MANNRKAGSVVIRLDLRGQEDLMRRLNALGPAGERVGRDLSRAMQPIKREGKLAKATIVELGDAVKDAASEAGPFGRILSSLGPYGLAAAAGLGVVAVAIREALVLMERANQTTDFAASITNVSRVAGVSAESVLVFRDSLRLVRGDAGQADRALEEFAKRLGEFRTLGTGEAREGLSALGLEALGANDLPVEQALDRVLERLAEIEDPARRLALADKLGLRDAAPLLQRTGDEISRIREQAELANQALTDGALSRFAEAADRIAAAELRQERARQIQSQALLGAEEARQNALARFEEQKAALLLSRVALEDRTLSQLELQADVLQEQITRYRNILGDGAQLVREQRMAVVELERMEDRLGRINEALAERQRIVELTARAESDLAASYVRAPSEMPGASNDNAANLSAERRLELEALVETRIRGLMTPVQQLAELESDLNAARRAGLEISGDQIAAILAQERARLGVVTAMERELRLRQDLLDMSGVVPRLRPGKAPGDPSDPGGADNPVINTEADKAKERAYEIAQAQSGRALGGLRRMAEDAQDTAGQIDDLATGSLRIMSGELGLVAQNAQSAGDAFENMGRRMLAIMVEMAMQRFVLGPIAGALFGPLEGLFNQGFKGAGGTKGLPGFDRGFEGMIRGNPGIDNNVLALNGRPFARVSDGESLMIGPSLGQRAQPNVTVNVIGAPGGARVKQRQTDNGLELDVILDLVRETAANTAVEVSAAAAKQTQGGLSQSLAQQTALKG
ncbi:MAG: hypothetical protein CMH91_01435 [Oceanicaulis sp.]|uniref:hypothetical protein n=1 Tax=unclassified Oceanicaulis TaxID=2632123 RepID=UPI000C4BF66E|nr:MULTISPECIES: hypothetical protein [unclassified Oceanicaulis]MBC37710.1 hypothetical protein [Oceanicaulis sp.]HBU61099.1 hypothetical protein [Oceanicaulis sp.]